MKSIIAILFSLLALNLNAQSYTSYFTGNSADTVSNPKGGVCLMGGATENDEAMKWFLKRVEGGDVLVLRASGSDGYNDYFFSELGISLNSVETIVFNTQNAANDNYIQTRIQQAEAIWLAGGDQWDYVTYWRNTPISTLINDAIQNRNIVIGGTSAGMAILGEYYFSAENGTVTSSEALENPYNENVTVDTTPFLKIPFLENVITDTHYDNPIRKGRHTTFLARILTDYGIAAKGIACNEYTSVCIDESGIARVFGDYPNYPEAAYFIQVNCENPSSMPENCAPGEQLNWNINANALKVYQIYGTQDGANTFDLTDWEDGNGGYWQNWFVDNGVFKESIGNPMDCSTITNIHFDSNKTYKVYPNPFYDSFNIEVDEEIMDILLYDQHGRLISHYSNIKQFSFSVDERDLKTGIYLIKIRTELGWESIRILKQ